MVRNPTSIGWAFFGTILFGVVFALPIIIGYFVAKGMKSSLERRKEKVAKDQTVI